MSRRQFRPIVADETPTVEFEGMTEPIPIDPEPVSTSDSGPARHRRARVLDVIGTFARLGLAAVWIVSGVITLLDPGQTYRTVKAYDVLPTAMIGPVADALPLVELCLGALILVGIGVRLNAALSAALLVVFIVAGRELLGDAAFLVLAGWLAVRPRTWASLDAITISRTPSPETETETETETEPPPAAPSSAAGSTKPEPAQPTRTAPRSAPANSADPVSHAQLVQQIAQVRAALAQTRRQLGALERAHAAQTARADRAEAARDAAMAHAAAVAQKPRTTRVAIIDKGRVTGIEMRTGIRAEGYPVAWPVH